MHASINDLAKHSEVDDLCIIIGAAHRQSMRYPLLPADNTNKPSFCSLVNVSITEIDNDVSQFLLL